MPRYMIDDRQAHHIYLLSSDIEEVKPTRDGVQIRVAWHKAYSKDDRFRETWDGNSLTVDLGVSQALQAVEQDREETKAFCTNCFDWGKTAVVPDGCQRCAILSALKKGKHGDFRRAASPAASATATQRSPLLCWLLLAAVLVTSWALCAWTQAASENEQLRETVKRVKGVRH